MCCTPAMSRSSHHTLLRSRKKQILTPLRQKELLTHVLVFDDAAEVLWVLHKAGQSRVQHAFIRGRRTDSEVHKAERDGQVVFLPQNGRACLHGTGKGGGMITRFYNIQCDGSSQLFGLTINNYRRESFYKMAVFHAQTMNLGCDAVWGCLHWRWENFEAGDPRQSSSLQSLGSSVPLELICFSSCLLLFTLLRAVIKTLAALLQDVRATESKHTALVESVIGALVKKQRRVQIKSSSYRAKNGRGVSAMRFYRGCVSDRSLHHVAS